MRVEFEVRGIPAPQGSKRHVGKGILIEQSKRVKPWRAAVKEAALTAMECFEGFPIETSVTLEVAFAFLRPKSHLKANGDLKPKSPPRHINQPDLDKLVRSTSDALTESGLIRDDSLIYRLIASKHYGSFNGARIVVLNEENKDE